MDIKQAQQALWDSHQAGDFYPVDWHNKLSVDEAYEIQLALLQRKIDGGASHTGWKVGLTADAVRDMYSAKEAVFGYLTEDGHCSSGHHFAFADILEPRMETEILVIMRSTLAGPNVSIDDARAAIDTIAPAFEVVETRGGGLGSDFPLGLVDNVSQRAYVAGNAIPIAAGFEFADIMMTLTRNDSKTVSVKGADVMDHQLKTIAWLANTLHRYGWSVEAGQSIMTGSFTKPAPIDPGDRYTASFSNVGDVSMSFST